MLATGVQSMKQAEVKTIVSNEQSIECVFVAKHDVVLRGSIHVTGICRYLSVTKPVRGVVIFRGADCAWCKRASWSKKSPYTVKRRPTFFSFTKSDSTFQHCKKS